MDIKAEIEKIVAKLRQDPKLLESFKADPARAVESLLGAVLPEGALDQVVAGVKAALAGGGLQDLGSKLKKLF